MPSQTKPERRLRCPWTRRFLTDREYMDLVTSNGFSPAPESAGEPLMYEYLPEETLRELCTKELHATDRVQATLRLDLPPVAAVQIIFALQSAVAARVIPAGNAEIVKAIAETLIENLAPFPAIQELCEQHPP